MRPTGPTTKTHIELYFSASFRRLQVHSVHARSHEVAIGPPRSALRARPLAPNEPWLRPRFPSKCTSCTPARTKSTLASSAFSLEVQFVRAGLHEVDLGPSSMIYPKWTSRAPARTKWTCMLVHDLAQVDSVHARSHEVNLFSSK